jgi:hypothetical protein
MATLRDLGLEPRATGAAPTLRDMGVLPRQAVDVMPLEDQASANSMGQLRRGFTSGLLGSDANAMAADESSLRAQGRAAEADALRSRIAATQQRAATFAPKEQDVTQLNWEPGRILDYGLGAVGQGTASMLEPAGAAAGLGAASQVLGAIPTAPTRLLSGALRLAAPAAAGYLNFRQAKGEFYNDAAEDPAAMAGKTPEEINAAANKSGVIAGAFDTILPGLAAERMVGRQGLKALAKAPTALKIGADLAGEGATEVMQGEVKRHFLGDLNPLRDTSKDTADRWNDLAGGILGAGPISTASHLMANGHKRLDVEDDPNNDVSGKAKPDAEPKTGGSFTDVLKRGAQERKDRRAADDESGANAWRNELSASEIEGDDYVKATQNQHAALVKELESRVSKGEAGAQEHLDAMRAQDPNDPMFPVDSEPRMAARDFLIGDGTDDAHAEKLLKAYQGRKLNTQMGYNDIGRKVAAYELGGKAGAGEAIKPNDPARAEAIAKYREMGQRARLTADVMVKALPEAKKKFGKVAAALGQELAHFAGQDYEKPTTGDVARVLRMGASMVSLYGGEKAHEMVIQAGRAAGIEGTKLFKTMNASVSVAREDAGAYQKAQTVSREAAAEQLVKTLPPAVELKLRKDGVDLTDPDAREHLLSMVEDSFDGTGMSEEAMTKTLGKEAVDALREVIGQPIAPRRRVAPTEEQSSARDTPDTKAPVESDENTGEGGLDEDGFEQNAAAKNVEKAPGSKIYYSRGKTGTKVKADGLAHPFTKDNKNELPWLSRADDRLTVDGDKPGEPTGANTLEDMHAKAYADLGGGYKKIVTSTKRPADGKVVTENIAPNEIAPDGKSPSHLGVGSYRVRTVSAKEVMDTHGVSADKRVELLREYAGKMRGGKVALSKDDPTIQQLSTLERRIAKLEKSTPKELVKGVGPKGATTAENPKRAEIDALKGQHAEAVAKLAAKVGVEPKDGMTVADIANGYFGDHFMVVAEQMAEKDHLRMDLSDVTKMVRRGNDDLDYSQQFESAGTMGKVQADMNLIRFESDKATTKEGVGVAVAKNGIAVIRAADLVKWVRDNRIEFNKRETVTEKSTAIDFRNDLMEGIGALAAGGYLHSMPFMLNAVGERESFEQGFPPSLKLETTTQRKLDNKREKVRKDVKARLEAGLPGTAEADTVVDQDAVAREQAVEPKFDRNTDADELIDEGRKRERPTSVVKDSRDFGPVPPSDDLEVTSSEQYWDAPGAPASEAAVPTNPTADERRFMGPQPQNKERRRFPVAPETVDNHDGQSSHVPSDFEPRKQKQGAVPTDRTELAMRNAVQDAALDKVDTLTPTNAMHRGARLAESIWGGFRDDPRGSFLRLQRLVNALSAPTFSDSGPVGGKHYAAAAAPLLTPSNIAKLVASAKDPNKAKSMLEGMRDKTAKAIATAEFEISAGDKLKLAKLLMGQPDASITKARAYLEGAKPIVSKTEPVAKKPGAVTLTGKSPYLAKDQAKADTATKFIGRGSGASSTAQYAKDFGEKANSGTYTAADRVFVSAEGNRDGRVNPDRAELDKAVAAGATFITDDAANRKRPYNVGERQIEKYLTEKGYAETKPGEWTKAESTAGRKLNAQTKPMQQLTASTVQTVAQTRSLMRLLGFKAAPAQFADVAEKLLTDPSQDPAAFIKQSAQALSHLLIRRDNVKAAMKGVAWAQERQRLIAKLTAEGMGRIAAQEQAFQTLVGEVLAEELKARTTAEHMSSSTIFGAAKSFVSSFKKMTASNEFTEVVRNELNKLIEQANNPERLKEGFAKVTFQAAVDSDPQAAAVLAHMATSPKIALTGSIVLSATGSVYRNAANMLHDLDFVVKGTHAAMLTHLDKAFPNSVQVNGFTGSAGTVYTHIVPPPGAKVVGMTYKAGKATYTIERDGVTTGRAWYEGDSERKEGERATTVDFFVDSNQDAAQIVPFTTGGKTHNVRVTSAGSIFEKKMEMARPKDMLDYTRYVPEAGRKLNAQTTPAGVQAAESTPDQTAIDEARAYVTKVLGPKVKVEFLKVFDAAGEWIDAENLMKLSLASGPGLLSVAQHEAMHALWGQLIKNHPDAAAKLSHVLSSPDVRARLEAILHDEPEALKQLSDPEERVAYAYQFWAAGMLDVDKPATTLFAKMRKFLRKVFGYVRDSETALDIMTAFHDGKLAEPSAAGRAIEKIMARETWNEDVKRKFDGIIQHLHSSTMVSGEVLRSSESETAQRLADMMFSNPGRAVDGENPEGYLNARTRVVRQYTNFLYKAVKNLSPRDMESAVNFLQNPDAKLEDIHYAPVREAVKDIRALTKRYYNYATRDAGMNLEYLGDNHFPRVWDVAQLVEKRDQFIAMVMQPKYAKTMQAALKIANNDSTRPQQSLQDIAALMHEELVRKNGVDEKGMEAERDDNDVLSPFFASQKERSFKWLDAEDVKPFLEKDLIGAMSRYLHQGIRAAEYTRRFGNGGMKLRAMVANKGEMFLREDDEGRMVEDRTGGSIYHELVAAAKEKKIEGVEAEKWVARRMEDIKNSVAAHEGSLGSASITPMVRKFSSAAMAYQNLRLLPFSLFAAFADPLSLAARGPGVKAGFDAFTQGLKDVWARWKDAASDMPAERQRSVWDDMAETAGVVDSHMFLEQIGKAHTSEFMTDFARKSNRALFMANGLTAWDRSMRVTATKYAALFLQDHKGLPDKNSARWLKELGLEPQDIPLDANGKLIFDRNVLAASRLKEGMSDEAKSKVLADATQEIEKVHYAITRWVEGAVLTPNAAQRPTWGSDPRWAVLFHLKQFTYSFQDTVLRRAFAEASQGNMNPIGALAASVPTMMVSDILKGFVMGGGSLPPYMKTWGLGDHLMHGVSRAGLGGVGQFGIDALRDPVSLAGPTVEQFTKVVFNPGELGKNLVDAIPGARFLGPVKDLGKAID